MHLTFFYRKPSPEFHSIEQIFDTVSEYLPGEVSVTKVYAPYQSKGLLNRIKIGFHARKNQGDINHITGFIHFIAPFLNKKKTILTIHDLNSNLKRSFIKQIIIKWFWFIIPAKSVDRITVISEFTKQELLQYINIKPEKIRVIPNCVSPVFQFKHKVFNKEKPHILQIGTKSNKNLLRLIEALKGINCKLLIVGKPDKEQMKHLKQNKIEYENYFDIPQAELLDLYEKSDIVSFVSTYEGFGMPVIEANAVGRPVITSDIEPMKTVAGDAALLVNPYDVQEIRKGILQIINNDELRQQLIKSGQKNAAKYSPQNIAMQYFKLYKELL